jgi:hypothetical protein
MITTPCRLTIAGAALWLGACAGCAHNQADRVPVSGRILIDGKPLTAGTIRFVPESGRPASGRILADGTFIVSSEAVNHLSQLGLQPGNYRVQISASKVIDDATIRWKAPARYADFRTSGLQVTIQNPTDDLLIELTWDGGEPKTVNSTSAAGQPSKTKDASSSDDQGEGAI